LSSYRPPAVTAILRAESASALALTRERASERGSEREKEGGERERQGEGGERERQGEAGVGKSQACLTRFGEQDKKQKKTKKRLIRPSIIG